MNFLVEDSSSSDDFEQMEQLYDEDDADMLDIMSGVVTTVSAIAATRQAGPSRVAVPRDREGAHERLMGDYFAPLPKYTDEVFENRFRMSKRLFLKITGDLETNVPYFAQKRDSAGKLGHSALVKCTSAIRQLAYGLGGEAWDEYLQIAGRTSRETLEQFCHGIITLYETQYLRRPTSRDLQRIYAFHEEKHGFPGMMGSIDCMHWKWANCPSGWHGTYKRGDVGKPSMILQAVASQDLWIWHAYFGHAGASNDINVFRGSPLFEELISGLLPTAPFQARGHQYDFGYFLGDGIYPEWPVFVKTFTDPIDEERIYFKKKQEAARKDIERAFGVLKKRWHYISEPARLWDMVKLQNVMYTCIILHNMILQDEGSAKCEDYDPSDITLQPGYWRQQVSQERRNANIDALQNRERHHMLTADLVEHLWMHRRN